MSLFFYCALWAVASNAHAVPPPSNTFSHLRAIHAMHFTFPQNQKNAVQSAAK